LSKVGTGSVKNSYGSAAAASATLLKAIRIHAGKVPDPQPLFVEIGSKSLVSYFEQ
jgi:hypothetical protein